MRFIKNPRSLLTKGIIWIKELRAPFFTATIVPITLGAVMAWHEFNVFNMTRFMLTLIAALCLNAGTNMINDYFDYRSGCDLHPTYQKFWAPFFGGSRLLPLGLLKSRDVYVAGLFSFGLGGAIGIFLALEVGWIVVLFGVIGFLSGYFYVTHLLALGMGEFFVFFDLGPLMVVGSYYVQIQRFTIEPIMASIPIGLLIANVLLINEIPDYIADSSVGKNTLAVRLGRKRAADLYATLMAAAYAFIVLEAGLGLIPVYSLIALATLPMALKSIKIARKYCEEPRKMVSANILSILVHLITGLLIIMSYVLNVFMSL